MSKFKHPSSINGYFYVCDSCNTEDGRPVLTWEKEGFSLCFFCLDKIAKKYLYPPSFRHEKIIIRRKSIPEETRDKILKKHNNRCCRCGSTEKLEFDHIVPFSLGGKTIEENIQVLCKACNRKKGVFCG